MTIDEQDTESDAAFTPIHGITLDRYAELSAALARQRLTDPEQVDAWMTTMGVPSGCWADVDEGWARRMAANAQVRNRYDALYGRL